MSFRYAIYLELLTVLLFIGNITQRSCSLEGNMNVYRLYSYKFYNGKKFPLYKKKDSLVLFHAFIYKSSFNITH